MQLAKPCFDIGLMTKSIGVVEPFWRDQIALPLDHILQIEPDYAQHRYLLGDSILKLNARADPNLSPSGYRELLIARANATEVSKFSDPDGNEVSIVPVGYQHVTQIGVRLRVADLSAHRVFYERVLGLTPIGENAFSAGQGVILLEQGHGGQQGQTLWGKGWRYLTFQIFDVRAEYAGFIARGGIPGTIQQLRDVARVAMVRDPDGNWLELSQRASLTGPLGQ